MESKMIVRLEVIDRYHDYDMPPFPLKNST